MIFLKILFCRQARSIQELAQKNFDNLRQDSDDNEAEPKVIRRGRPPTKHFKKPPGRPSLERAASEFASDATPATGQENTLWSNHDMRRGPLASDKSNFADSSGKFYGSRNDVYSGSFTENKSNRNDEGIGKTVLEISPFWVASLIFLISSSHPCYIYPMLFERY